MDLATKFQFILVLFFFSVVRLPVGADGAEPQKCHIEFLGYQRLNGLYVFQFRIMELPFNAQPPLRKIGDLLGWGGYTIRDFRQKIKAPQGEQMALDVSEVDLENPNTHVKITLPFRQMVAVLN
jgi:hypothetical protein